MVVIFSMGSGGTTAMNIYCGVLSTITVGQTFKPDWKADATARIVLSLIFIVLALAMALLGAKNFMVNYENFLALFLCVMPPWTPINLVDFYLVHHGHYHDPSFSLSTPDFH